MSPPVDLGGGVTLRWNRWDPDLDINPRWTHLAGKLPVARWGATIFHTTRDGKECLAGLTFDGEVQREVDPDGKHWTVQSWDPLTITPSIPCRSCGAHGFVTNGRWVSA